eukprot:COSAG02_NODE_4950_length_4796_cov_7.041729_6_plen_172_part_00
MQAEQERIARPSTTLGGGEVTSTKVERLRRSPQAQSPHAPAESAPASPVPAAWLSEAGLRKDGCVNLIEQFWDGDYANGRVRGEQHEVEAETRCPWCCQFGPKTGPGGGFVETDPPFKRLAAHRCAKGTLLKPPKRTREYWKTVKCDTLLRHQSFDCTQSINVQCYHTRCT